MKMLPKKRMEEMPLETGVIYSLPQLEYGYADLEPLYSAELLELHHVRHHQAYIDGANDARAALSEARQKQDYDKLNQLQKDLAFNVSGHVLHSIFWQNMAPNGKNAAPEALRRRINQAFGSFDGLRTQFFAAGSSIQGSGWAALAWDPLSRSLLVQQLHDHQSNVAQGTIPLLVMDMWEHAYYLQYLNDKKRWAKSFWDLINWSNVDARLAVAESNVFDIAPDGREQQKFNWA